MPTKILSFFSKTYNTFISWVRKVVSKWTCSSGIHTKPIWRRTGYTSPTLTYFGVCRNCSLQITPNYRFNEGPLLEGIKPDPKTGNRNLEAIIHSCIQMFLKEWDDKRTLPKKHWMDLI